MSFMLDAEPVVLEETEQALQCRYLLCEERALWSTLWTCGETIVYCEPHLRWAQHAQPVVCACNDEIEIPSPPPIYIVMTVPL